MTYHSDIIRQKRLLRLRSEAFGVSLLEGAMYGKPMISSEIGTGTTFVNVAGETRLVVPPNDPAAPRACLSPHEAGPEAPQGH